MPVEFLWHEEEKAIAICTMSGEWTWDEFFQARTAFRQKHQISERERVDLIWQVTHDATMPTNFIPVMQSAVASASRNWAITVVVDPGLLLKSLLGVVTRTHPETKDRFPIAQTYEEACEIIERHRSKSLE